jgi:O-acetylhomoserine/O-acetylserine sulfhydrylase-like pyridoxal-dependent enzyme
MKQPTAKQLAKQIDDQITAIYCRRFQNVEINIMDIGKVYAAGRQAVAEGRDIETAIVARVATLDIHSNRSRADLFS